MMDGSSANRKILPQARVRGRAKSKTLPILPCSFLGKEPALLALECLFSLGMSQCGWVESVGDMEGGGEYVVGPVAKRQPMELLRTPYSIQTSGAETAGIASTRKNPLSEVLCRSVRNSVLSF